MGRHPRAIVTLSCLLLALGVWRVALPEFRLDDSFITYRCARNLARGLGLVYNPGERVLVTSAPLFAVVLALGGRVVPDLDLLGRLLGAIAIGLGGALMAGLVPAGVPRWIRAWTGIAYVLASPLWLALGMETPLWLLAVLGAAHLARASRWAGAGIVMGLATLTRPDAALPALLLGLVAARAGRGSLARYAAALMPLLAVAGLGLWLVYGSWVPATLAAKGAQSSIGITGLGVGIGWWQGLGLVGSSLVRQSPLHVTFVLLAAIGLATAARTPAAFLGAWGLLHLAAYAALGVAPYRWYYVPVLPALLVLAALGIDRLRHGLPRRAWPAVVLLALAPLTAELTSLRRIAMAIRDGGPVDPSLPIVDWGVYRTAGEWLNAHAPAGARVGVAEVGQLGFYADRPMTDYLGLLQPEVAALLRRHDLYSWLVGAAPEYLVLQRFRDRPLVLYDHVIENDPWFRASYEDAASFDDWRYRAGPVTVLRRVAGGAPLQPQSASHELGGLRLVGLATDGDRLGTAGGPLRVRLDWQVQGPLPGARHVAIKLRGLRADFDGDYATGRWQGAVSTFHGLVVPKGVRIGSYPILVAVGPREGPYDSVAAGELRIAREVSDTPAAAPTIRRTTRTRP